MKFRLFFLLGLGIGVGIFYFIKDYTKNNFPSNLNSLTPTYTPSFTLTPTIKVELSPTFIPTITFSLTPSSSVIPTKIPIPAVTSQEINGFIDRFAGQYGIDSNVLRHIAICESGFDPLASNGPYGGLFQFSSSTWNLYRLKIGDNPNPDLRFNAEEAVQTAAYITSIGKSSVWPNCVP